MKFKYVSLFAVFLVIISGIPIFSSGSISTITNYAHARYAADAQTQANANECATGANCGITSPQTQGDGTAPYTNWRD